MYRCSQVTDTYADVSICKRKLRKQRQHEPQKRGQDIIVINHIRPGQSGSGQYNNQDGSAIPGQSYEWFHPAAGREVVVITPCVSA
jgi:hypothetical protein